ncbi:MAG: DUF3306 domain-containing protein [Ramlibacter sp.]
MADGFLGRWSRRKLDAKEGRPLEPEPPAAGPAEPAVAPVPLPGQGGAGLAADDTAPTAPALRKDMPDAPPEPPPTMADAQALTPASDFSRYTGTQVAPEVRNAAMKKLFSDPHFNVMDGLDIYIDDYGKPDPMPASMLRGLASAEFLGLFREDPASPPRDNPQARAEAAPEVTTGAPLSTNSPQFVAQSGPPGSGPLPANEPAARAPDADPDLRLQQDPAPGPQGPGEGAR